MASFYGGKQGITYNLVERYDRLFFDVDNQEYVKIIGSTISDIQENQIFSITIGNNNVHFYMALSPITACSTASTFEDTQVVQLKGMINCFNKGGAYTDVNYGEYVIIDTIANLHQKNNQQNGLLYRRGFQYEIPYRENNFQDPGGGAIYVGQIVGPQGENTQISVVDWGTNEGAGTTAEIAIAGVIEENDVAIFNDKAIAKSINNLDSYGNISSANLEFQIPYPVIKLSASTVDTATGATSVWHDYYNNEGTPTSVEWEAGQVFIHRAETQHPYYLDYQIAIPKGDKGDKGDTGNGISSMGIQNGYVWVHYTDDENPGTRHNLGLTGSAYSVANVFESLGTLTSAYPNGFWANAGSSDATPLGYTALVKQVPEGSATTHTYIYAYDILNEYDPPENGWKKAYDLGSSEIVAEKFIDIMTNTQESFPGLLEDGGFAFVNYIPPQEGD